MTSPIRFDGRCALVTGASGHIGRRFCHDFASFGGQCILVDQDNEALKKLTDTLPSPTAGRHVFWASNLDSPESRESLLRFVRKEFLSIDLLVNNAAYTGDSSLKGWAVAFEDQSRDAWSAAMEVNLTAVFDLIQNLVPLLERGKNASIINVSSIYGMIGPDMSLYEGTSMGNPLAYAVSKGGLIQMTRWLSTVLAPSIRVNAVSPGGIFRGQQQEFVDRYISKTPLGRMASEEDVSGCLLFLASNLASYITGHNIVVDGGFTVR